MATTSLNEETSIKVLRQVEFYFSDSNLPMDDFLKKKVSESKDGMVSLELICSFSKMRNYLGLGDVKAVEVPEDIVSVVADTLRSSHFLKVSDDGKKVGRRIELAKQEEVIEQLDNRTIAASPLPYDVTHEDVETFFTQHAKVNSIRLPRHVSNKNSFSGTALIEFSSEEDAEKVLKKSFAYSGVELELKPKKNFDNERKKQALEYENSQGHSSRRGFEEANYCRGLIIAFTLKSKSSGGERRQNGAHKTVPKVQVSKTNKRELVANVSVEANKVSANEENVDDRNVEEFMEKAAKGSNPEGQGKEIEDGEKSSEGADKEDMENAPSEGKTRADASKDKMDVVVRENLQAVFERFGTVKYIDFKMGEDSGYIQFEKPEAAQKARAVVVLADEGGLPVKNYIATLEPVTGEAEKQYWSRVQGSEGRFQDKGHKGRGGKYNRVRRHGRSRENDSPAGRPKKLQKVAT